MFFEEQRVRAEAKVGVISDVNIGVTKLEILGRALSVGLITVPVGHNFRTNWDLRHVSKAFVRHR